MAEDKNETSPSAEGEKPQETAAASPPAKEEPTKEDEKNVEENSESDETRIRTSIWFDTRDAEIRSFS